MKKIVTLLTVIFTICFSAPSFAESYIVLPSPDIKGGISLHDALLKLEPAQTMDSSDEISLEVIAKLMWAATGKNREQGSWTVPFMQNLAPYVVVNVLNKDGAYSYDWDRNVLEMESSDKKLLARAVTKQGYDSSPIIIVLTTRGRGPAVDSWADFSAGAIAQNIMLEAENCNVKTAIMPSYNKMALIDALHLGPLSRILAVMPVCKK